MSAARAPSPSKLFRHRSSLLLKLAGFYLLISLPTLLLVEATVQTLEFRAFAAEVDRGALLPAMQTESRRLRNLLASADESIARELDAWILELERPGANSASKSHVLMELSEQPFAAMLRFRQDERSVRNERADLWQIDVSGPLPEALGSGAREIARHDAPDWMRRFSIPISDAQGIEVAHLILELRLPLPWRKLLFKVSYEWPLLLAYLLVFSIGTVLFFNRWVTRRLNRIANAAEAWRRGEFATLIDDSSEDELGGMSRRLDLMAADLRDLVHARAEVAALNERARLARDLHDTVKQKAFALTMQIAAVRAELKGLGGEGQRTLEECRKLAEEIQQELALILDELRRDQGGAAFHAELRARVESWSRRSGIKVRAELQGADQVRFEHRDTLARLIDEALANVQRHSHADHAEIELIAEKSDLRLLIADNGRGMPSDRGEGMGLGNMRRRVADLPQGQFKVESGHGVRIIVTWKNPDSSK